MWIYSSTIYDFCIFTCRCGRQSPLLGPQIYVIKLNILARKLRAAHELYCNWWAWGSRNVFVMNVTEPYTWWLHIKYQIKLELINVHSLSHKLKKGWIWETNHFVTMWIWAVLLVYDDGVLNIFHVDVLEKHAWRCTWRRSWPRFDSNSILCTNQGAIVHSNASHIFLIWVLAKATHTVSWT